MIGVKTTIDMFYEMALMAFYDGYIAIYVNNKEIADVLYKFCWDYLIEMDYPNGEGRGIQIDYTYKVSFIELISKDIIMCKRLIKERILCLNYLIKFLRNLV